MTDIILIYFKVELRENGKKLLEKYKVLCYNRH